MSRINLLQETLKAIQESGHSVKDVAWVGAQDGSEYCTWEEFEKMADKLYFNGHGLEEVRTDLVVVFKDGSWLERWEYDGAEGWEFKRTPRLQPEADKLTWVFYREEHEE